MPENVQERPRWLSEPRIPSLDGLRALSIMAVTLSHLVSVNGIPLDPSWRVLDGLGNPGVDIFFVISGFLITHLLLKERAAHGAISLPNFYLRRSLRILPAYGFFLFVLYVLSRFGLLSVDPRAWIPAVTYTYNLIAGLGTASLGQIWSLCVEEHFYLLWPVALIWAGQSRAWLVLVVTIALAPVARFAIWAFFGSGIDVDVFTLTRLDTIAVGCLLALVAHERRFWPALNRVSGRGDWLTIAASIFLLVSWLVLSDSGKYQLGVKRLAEGIAIATIVYSMVADHRSRIAQFLNTRLMTMIGVLSYSLYLGQFVLQTGPEWPVPWWLDVPLLLLYAAASYALIERPMLSLKDRLSRGSASHRRHSAAEVVSA